MNLEVANRLDEALILFSSPGEVSICDLAYVAPAIFQRAEIHESRGVYAHASQEHERVVHLWQEADPEQAGHGEEGPGTDARRHVIQSHAGARAIRGAARDSTSSRGWSVSDMRSVIRQPSAVTARRNSV